LGKAFELPLFEDYTSENIFDELLKLIQKLNNEGIYKNRYINIEIFKNVGKYINWVDLVRNINNELI